MLNLVRQGWNAMHAVWRAGSDFIYPSVCAYCGRELESPAGATEKGPSLCVDCRAGLVPEPGPSCRRCAAPVGPHLDTSDGCIHCRDERFAFETVVRLGVYDAMLRTVCLRSKHPGGEALAAAAAELLWDVAREGLRATGADLVLPVPQHWTRRLRRSHNPAETVGRILARRLHVPFRAHILCKVRRTPDQARLTPTERRTNLRGAFRARGGEWLSGRSILLADDVLTTGTTAQQAARTLRRAGARRVVVAVLARGIGR